MILRNYEGMLVRYQAEDKPITVKPTANRGVSQLVQGSASALVPQGIERMERRRQYLQNKAAEEEKTGCCDGHDEVKPTERRPRGRKFVASLPVVAEA